MKVLFIMFFVRCTPSTFAVSYTCGYHIYQKGVVLSIWSIAVFSLWCATNAAPAPVVSPACCWTNKYKSTNTCYIHLLHFTKVGQWLIVHFCPALQKEYSRCLGTNPRGRQPVGCRAVALQNCCYDSNWIHNKCDESYDGARWRYLASADMWLG